jgi:hypothetical protein
MQNVVDVHETPFKSGLVPAGCGVASTVQLMPFQRSIRSVPKVLETGADPTAMHDRVDVHETPFRMLFADPGLGEVAIVQADPSQTSASVLALDTSTAAAFPTAAQNVVDVHEIPFRPAFVRLGGLGVATIDHLVPSQRCDNVIALPGTTDCPTAMHAPAARHETDARPASVAWGGFGTV